MAADDYDDIEAAIPATTVRVADLISKNQDSSQTKDAETKSTNNDKELMPPPSVPLKTQTR